MNLNEILKSEDYKDFLARNLTQSQHESILLKYLIKLEVENFINSGKTKQEAFRCLSVSGFLIDRKKIIISKKTIEVYYYTLK